MAVLLHCLTGGGESVESGGGVGCHSQLISKLGLSQTFAGAVHQLYGQ